MPVTQMKLHLAFRNAIRAAEAIGLDTEGWTLEEGDGSVGESTYLRSAFLDERLGGSRAEAYGTLHAMANAWRIEKQQRDRVQSPENEPVKALPG